MGKIKNIAIISILIFIAAYFIPIPHRIHAEMPAIIYNSEGSYTFSINARRHNYLIKHDCIIPEIKVYSDNETVFSFEDIDYSMYKSSIPIEDTGDVTHVSFLYYTDNTNNMEPASLVYAKDESCFILKTEGFTCIAPAESNEDAQKIIQYFKDKNFDPGL